MKLKPNLEYFYLFVIVTALLFFGLGNLWGHTLQHKTPTGYHASDAYQHQTRAQAIKDVGTYVHEPSWIVAGYTDIIGFYPPGLYYLSIGLSNVSGLEVFDTIYIMGFFFAVISAVLFYFTVRKFNKTVAILAIPFSILIFTGISMVGFTWGALPSITSQVFIIMIIWALAQIELPLSWLVLGLSLGAAVLTHSSELVIGGGFMAAYFLLTLGIHFFIKQNKFIALRNMIIGGIIFVAISWYFILIAQLIWAKLYPFDPKVVWLSHGGYPGIVNLTDYGLLLLVMGIGFILGLYLLWKNKTNPPVAILAGLYMIVIGYGNFYGLNYRAFQIRYLWPIYLSVFLGLGIYIGVQFLAKNIRNYAALAIGVILLIIFSGMIAVPAIPHYEKLESQGMDQYHWDTFTWLRENTPKNAILYFFYGDLYVSNAVLRNTERTHYQVISNPDYDFVKKSQTGIVTRTYDSALLGDCCGADYPYWKGFGVVGFRFLELGRPYFYKNSTDICQMDYYIFDKASAAPQLAQYNILIATQMLKSGHFQVVYENPLTVVLKNNKPGENCIGNSTAT